MKKSLKVFLLTGCLLFLAGFGSGVFAQADAGANIGNIVRNFTGITFGDTCSTEEIGGILCILVRVINLLLGMSGIVAVAALTYGGIMYTVSGGDMKQLESAKAAITYALFGLAIVLGAILLVNSILVGSWERG